MPTSPPLPAWLIAELDRRALRLDADQAAAAARLDALLTGALPEDIIGAYCYGPPGRGKSLLAALFHQAYPGTRVRTHFHAFLRDVNRRLVAAPPSDDKLGGVLAQWLGDSRLLWFDEFHVHNIADALILAALLRVAIARRVYLLLTSNQVPEALLPDPEFHHRFEPTIAALQAHCLMLPFEGAVDYRRIGLARVRQSTPTEQGAPGDDGLAALFARHGDTLLATDTRVSIATRTLEARAIGAHTLLCDFDALCAQARSHLDYLDLAARHAAALRLAGRHPLRPAGRPGLPARCGLRGTRRPTRQRAWHRADVVAHQRDAGGGSALIAPDRRRPSTKLPACPQSAAPRASPTPRRLPRIHTRPIAQPKKRLYTFNGYPLSAT